MKRKFEILIVLGLSVAIGLFAFWPSPQNSYPYFFNNPHLDKKMKKLMAPYLLPLEHPVKAKLDNLFFSGGVITNKQTLLASGFDIIASTDSSCITVVRHPDMPGFVFKLYLDSENRTKKGISHCEWLTRRCIGAEKIRKIIKKKHLRYFTVPDKWLYVLPSHDLEPVIVVETDMQLESESTSFLAWKTHITKAHLDELHSILKERCGTAYLATNIPYTKRGVFAFIDTEYPDRKINLKKAGRYLSEENQQYWQKLTSQSPG